MKLQYKALLTGAYECVISPTGNQLNSLPFKNCVDEYEDK